MLRSNKNNNFLAIIIISSKEGEYADITNNVCYSPCASNCIECLNESTCKKCDVINNRNFFIIILLRINIFYLIMDYVRVVWKIV